MTSPEPEKHSFKGHLKTMVIAAAFGLGAYAIVKLVLLILLLTGLIG